MKKKTGIIATSVAAIALSSSLIVGTTYALFTSESSVNIAVTSAKVNVEASIVEDSVYTKQLNTGYEAGTDGLFGGSVELEGNSLNVKNFAAGDGVKFNINIVNSGSINAKYRTVLTSESGLGELEATFGGVDGVYDGATLYSNWEDIAVDEENSVTVTLELPETAVEQDVTYSISFAVEAVQGNAQVVDESTVEADLYIHNKAELFEFAKSVNEGNNYAGKTVALLNNIDLNNEAWSPIGTNPDNASYRFAGVFDGLNHTISNLYVNITENGRPAGLFGAVSGTVQNFTINNATVYSENTQTNRSVAAAVGIAYPSGKVLNVTVKNIDIKGHRQVGGIVGYLYGTISNCHVLGGSIIVTPNAVGDGYDNGDKVGGIVGFMGGDSGDVYDCSVKDITISAYRDVGGITGLIYQGSVGTFKNNTVENVTISLDNSLITTPETTIGEIIGRYMDGIKPEDIDASNTATNVELN